MTHNSFSIVDAPSLPGVQRLTLFNQEDTVTNQLRVCDFLFLLPKFFYFLISLTPRLVSESLVKIIRKGKLNITYLSVLDFDKRSDQLTYVLYAFYILFSFLLLGIRGQKTVIREMVFFFSTSLMKISSD